MERERLAPDALSPEAPQESSQHALIGIARRWLAAFEARDLDALLALYAADARHTSPKLRVLRPETGGFLIGTAQRTRSRGCRASGTSSGA